MFIRALWRRNDLILDKPYKILRNTKRRFKSVNPKSNGMEANQSKDS